MTITAVLVWEAVGSKRGRHGDASPGPVHPTVVLRYVERFQESGMKRGSAEAAQSCFKTEVADLSKTQSIEKQCAFVQNITDPRGECEGEVNNFEEN